MLVTLSIIILPIVQRILLEHISNKKFPVFCLIQHLHVYLLKSFLANFTVGQRSQFLFFHLGFSLLHFQVTFVLVSLALSFLWNRVQLKNIIKMVKSFTRNNRCFSPLWQYHPFNIRAADEVVFSWYLAMG
jgi:hypothetical protein